MAVFKLTNTVRSEHYWYDLLTPYLSQLIENQELVNASGAFLGLHVTPFEAEELSSQVVSRLKSGRVVVDNGDDLLSAMVYLPSTAMADDKNDVEAGDGVHSEALLILSSEKTGDQVYDFIAWLLRYELTSILQKHEAGNTKLNESISLLEDKFDIKIQQLERQGEMQASFLLEALADKGYAKLESANELKYFLGLEVGQVFSVELPAPYKSTSLPVIVFLMVISIISIAFLAYSFVQGVDRRIRTIETAASRISRGELDARVTKAGDEDAISRLGLSFNSMADHIQRLMYVQKEMIHAVSHELRTPVARIRFGVQMIEDCQTPESVHKQVKGIDGDIQELDELIDEILTYARLEQGGPILAFQQADVAAIVEQVVSEQSTDKPEINITCEFKQGSKVWKESEIETRYIHRSIQNLVGNAKRYADSKVNVVCSFDAETCRIDVEDDGPGIPEDQWESVFTPFARLDDSRTRSSGGYGLGLSIVRRILYWHGGQAFLGRSSMGGAKFSLVWPRKQSV